MKNKLFISTLVLLIISVICLVFTLVKVKKLNDKMNEITKTEETQTKMILDLQTEVAHLKIQQQESKTGGSLEKKSK